LTSAPADEPVARDAIDSRRADPAVDVSGGWVRRELVSQGAAGSSAEDDKVSDEVSDEELLEFLAADDDRVEANPIFKRKLREKLWAMIRENNRTRQ
jgi:hypothetical protein